MARKLAKKKPDTLYYEAMEERVLFSADAAPGLDLHLIDGQALVDDVGSTSASVEPQDLSAAVVPTSIEPQRELVIVNPNIDDYQQLISDLRSSAPNRHVDVAILDPEQDGIGQVTDLLAARSDLSAIHFITHGADGQINLGDDWLNAATLQQNADQVATWGQALTDSGDILFYGCNVAADGDGQSLVDDIAWLTGADVAASDDLTGSASKGGDWILEYDNGAIETGSVIAESVQAAWDHSLSTVTVDTIADTLDGDTSSIGNLMLNKGADGYISLREAITAANNTANPDTINFSIGTGSQAISLGSDLPAITDTVTIDGATQPGYTDHPLIIIDANQLSTIGFELTATADGSTIRGLVLRDFASGGSAIQIDAGSDGNTIDGNYIGSFGSAGVDLGIDERNAGAGITVNGKNNTIGGTTTAERNVIGGNTIGIVINGANASGNSVLGNYIGTDASGNTATANSGNGITVENGATANTIGGSTSAEGNIISGNTQSGIQVDGEASDGNIIENNWIGLGADGLTALGNGGDGIFISSGSDNTIVGGANMGNVVAGSGLVGIEIDGVSTGTVIQGNIVGTDQTGTQNWGSGQNAIDLENGAANTLIGGTGAGEGNVLAYSGQSSSFDDGIAILGSGTGNSMLGNSIFSNPGLGIDLNDDGVTANDAGDGDTGANGLQNFPVLTSVDLISSTQLSVSGSLNSAASSHFRIEFFASASGDGSGYGEGQRYLGYANVDTDGSGNATIDATLTASVSVGEVISATATQCDASYTTFTNTSEFSSDMTVTNTAPVLDNSINVALTSQNEDSGPPSGPVGTMVASLVDLPGSGGGLDNVTDADSGAVTGLAVTAANTTNGSWWYTTDNGSNWYALGAVSGSNARLLAADATTWIYFEPDADYNGTVSTALTYRAWDQTIGANGGLADTSTNGGDSAFSIAEKQVDLVINSVNDAPAGTDNTVTTSEDTAYTFSVGDFGLTDVDGDSFEQVWITTLPGQGQLKYKGATFAAGNYVYIDDMIAGQLTYEPAANANGTPYTSFTFQVQDNGGTANGGVNIDPTPNTMTIDVTPANDAPTASDNTVTTGEDTTYTFTAGDFNFSDIDSDSLASVKITSLESAGVLRLSGVDVVLNQVIGKADIDAGNLTFAPAVNANGAGYDSFGFSVNDGSVDSASAYTMTIDVTAANDAPTASDNTVTTVEDTAYTFAAGDFNFSDIDGDSLASVKITTLETAGALQLSGTDVVLNQVIGKADIDACNLTFAPAANANGAGYDSFGFSVNDGSVDSASTYTMTIDVTPANDAPTASDGTVTTAEDTAYTFAAGDFGFSDIDGDSLASVKITSLESAGILQLSGADVTLNQVIGRADIDACNLTFAPAANANGAGYDSFGFSVNDGSADSASTYTMTINVTAANDAPVITSDGGGATASVNAAENQTAVTTVTASDADGETPTFSISGGTDAALFGIDANTGVLTFNTAPDYENPTDGNADGVYEVQVTAADGNGGTDTQLISVAVTDANDAPTDISLSASSVNQSGGVNAVVGSLTTADADTGDSHTYTLVAGVGSTDNGLFNISGGQLRANDAGALSAGSYSVRIQTDDGNGGTFQKAFTVTVVDDVAPSMPADANASANSVTEGAATGTAVGITAQSSDSPASAIGYDLTDDAGGRFQIDAGTGVVTVADGSLIDFESGTSHTITVRATDAAGNTSSQTFTINVTNTAPTAADDSATTGENSVLNVAAGVGVLANDTDPNGFNGNAAVSAVQGAGGNVGAAVAGSTGGSFTVNADGSFGFDPGSDFDDLAVGDSRDTAVTYTLTDGTATGTAILTVTVDGVNDAALIGGDTSAGVTEDGTLTATGVLTISDADAGEAVFTAQSAAASASGYGTVELDAAGNWTYTLDNANATVQSLSAGQTLSDSFTAVSADGSTQVVTITITGADDGAGGSTGTVTQPGEDTGTDDPGSGDINDTFPQVPTDDTPLEYPPMEITIDPVQERPDDDAFVSQPFSNTDVSQQFDGGTDADDAVGVGRRDGREDHVYREDVRLRELYFSKHTRFKTAENIQVAAPQIDFSQIDLGSQASQRLDMQGAYDLFRDQLDQAFGDEKKSLAFRSKMAFIATATLTAGVVTYLLRASSLLSSLLFSLPAWHRFDPIAVFAGKRRKRKDARKSRDAGQIQSEAFFDGDAQ